MWRGVEWGVAGVAGHGESLVAFSVRRSGVLVDGGLRWVLTERFIGWGRRAIS